MPSNSPKMTSMEISGRMASTDSALPRASLGTVSVIHALKAASLAVEPKNVITQSSTTIITAAAATAEAAGNSYLKTLVYGLRPSVVRENPALYLSFAAFCLFSVAVQVFFPYLIIYMQNYLHFDGYALVLGIVLIFASVVSVLSGRVIDRLGELRCVLPAAGIMFAGLLGMFFARSMLAVILTGCVMMSGS